MTVSMRAARWLSALISAAMRWFCSSVSWSSAASQSACTGATSRLSVRAAMPGLKPSTLERADSKAPAREWS